MIERQPHADSRGRAIARWMLGTLYLVAGIAHIAHPAPFVRITPDWVPMANRVVFWTGIAELAGAAALVQPWNRGLRRAAAQGLALYALCVWPANANHMLIDLAKAGQEGMAWPGWAYHLPRMAFQPVLIWLALWAGEIVGSGGAIDWPRRK